MGYTFTDSEMSELIHENGTTYPVVYIGASPLELFEQSTAAKHSAFIERRYVKLKKYYYAPYYTKKF